MPATAEKLDGSRVRLAVEVPPEDLQKEYGRAIQRVGRRVKIPGFRPGKAPRRLVENAAGVGTVLQDLMEAVVPRAYTSALDETGVTPIDQPELDVPELPTLDAPFLFSAEVAVAPTVELGDIDDVSIDVSVDEVTQDEIEAEVEQLRTTQAAWEPVERPAVAEDMVQTRIQIVGEGIEPEDPQPYNVLVGSNGFPVGFDGAVTGAVAGDSVSYDARIPPNDPNEALRGKDVTFEIQVDGVSERQLPDLDDEFARSVGPFENLEGMRERIVGALGERKAHEAQHQLEEQAVQSLVDRATFEIADVLLEREREQVLRERTDALVQRGIPVDTYLAMQGETRDAWEAQAGEEALNRIHRSLALDAYAEAQGIEADVDEMQAEVDRVAEYYPQERRNVIRSNLMRDEARLRVASTVRSRKAVAALVAAVTDGAAPLHDHEHQHSEPPPELAAAAEPEDDPEADQA
ncbi:MAG: trigger factor [Chloroflexota bacterium]|nr:trigger factor [Chloroflexota bacterium]